MEKESADRINQYNSDTLPKMEEAIYWAGLAVVCAMTAAGFIMFFLCSHRILKLEGMIAYGLDVMGLYASVFVYYGCMCSRTIRKNCSRLMVQLLIPTDCLFLFDAVYCVFSEHVILRVYLEIVSYPLILALMFLLWRYVHAAMPPKKAPVRIAEHSIRVFVIIGIAVWGVFLILKLLNPNHTVAWGDSLVRYEHLVLDVLIFLILLAVTVQVLASGGSVVQKLVTVLASLFLSFFLAADFFGNQSIWLVETCAAYGLIVLLICSAVFPDRSRIQEVISRVFAMILLGNTLVYGLFISVYYSKNLNVISNIESQELLRASADALGGISPDDPGWTEALITVRDMLDNIIALTQEKEVFCETANAATGERKEVIKLAPSQTTVNQARSYPEIDLKSILPDTLLPEEKAALAGHPVKTGVMLSANEEPVVAFFYPWIGKKGEKAGVITVCAYLERWMVEEVEAFFLHAVPMLILIMIGALALSTIIDRRLIRSMNLTIKNTRRFFVEGDWSAKQNNDSQSSYEGYYFATILSFFIEELKDRKQKLVNEIKKRERIDADLDLAAAIQSSIMPNHFPPFPDHDEFSIYASMHPARQVGGDFYDFYLLDSDRLVLLVADVSGKGIPSALFMMTARSILKASMIKYQNPAEALMDADRQLAENNKEQMFVTVWIGILELDSGRLITSNAGHERLLLYRDGAWEYVDEKPGYALALFAQGDEKSDQARTYCNYEVCLKEGDMIFQCTDGVTECVSEEKKFFGRKRLVETLGQFSGADPETLIEGVNRTLDQFRGNTNQFDDITVLSLQYKGAVRKPGDILSGFHSVEEILEQREWMSIAVEHAAFPQIRGRIMEICPTLSEAKPCILVCDEIFHNIVQYSGATRIWFFCESRETELEIGFMDDGNLFDSASVIVREKEFADLSNGGMGMTMIRTLAKYLRYERVGDCNLLCANVERKGLSFSEQYNNEKKHNNQKGEET